MVRMGFDDRWIARVMNCVTSVSYSFRVNQEMVGPIIPSRGLRQARGLFRGVKIAPTCPSVCHLFFADDSLVFFRATIQEGARVKECLSLYEKASGQLINYDKSAVSFSPNSSPALMDTIKTILTIPVVHQHDLYLGLPTISMWSKRLQFNYLCERVVKRIQGWNHKWFSIGGKEVLIKSVLQAIPTFAMSCFKMPIRVCEDIEKECANFWWGLDKGKRKMHWRSWDFLCKPKGRGGLGFRKLTEFNKALLAKQLWRLIRFPNSLVARVLKGRYFRHVSVLEARLGKILKIPLPATGMSDSVFWRFDAKGKYMVCDGCRLQRGLFSPPEHQSEHPNESWWEFIWSLSVPPKEATQTSTLDICMWLKQQLSKEEFENLAVHTWGIWKEKQNFIHGDRTKPMAENICWSSTMLCEFRKTRKLVKISNQSVVANSERKWTPPGRCTLKLNVDAAFNEDKQQYSAGGVIRDSQSRLLLAFGKQINQPLSVLHGELLAIREGIKLLYEKDFQDVQVESYSLLAVQAVTAHQEDLSYIDSCAADIRARIQAPIISKLSHVRRSANKVAYFLAHFVFSSPTSFVWMDG
ncbi:uncharacterized protein LOC142529488 [Primulina tabacum]|uniref:uncharacterized protein LOC142529488 n=1 Tax=Primulina tabacum TaxID=48773 RepID=UPI003F593465